MKSILVIGIGRFGKHLATTFAELGHEVMIVDRDEEKLESLLDVVTTAQIGDCKDEKVLRSMGVNNFDICFVCISSDFQSSLEVTSLLKELGARKVVCKAERDIHAKFLLRNGADEVVYPQRDMAHRTAVKYARNAFDYIELTTEYALFEIMTPDAWVGKSVHELAVRTRYNVNIIALKQEDKVVPMTSADYVFKRGDHLFISGTQKDCAKLLDK